MINRLKLRLLKISEAIFYFFVWSTMFLIFSAFFNIKVEGKGSIPKKGRFILAGNHQNFFDGFFLVYPMGPFRKVNFVIAKRSMKLKIFQIIARIIGSVLLGNSIEEYQRMLKKLNNVLSHGGKIGIFPEGDISPKSVPRKFKGGVAKLSIDSKSKVIPIFISGTYKMRSLKYWLTRPTIVIKIGKPIELYTYVNEFGNDLDQIAAVLREKVIELMPLKSNSIEQKTAVPFFTSVVKETAVEL